MQDRHYWWATLLYDSLYGCSHYGVSIVVVDIVRNRLVQVAPVA